MTQTVDQLSDEEVISNYVERMTKMLKESSSLLEATIRGNLKVANIVPDDFQFTGVIGEMVKFAQDEFERAQPRFKEIATSHLTVQQMRAYLRFLEENPGFDEASRTAGSEIGRESADIIDTIAKGLVSMVETIKAKI